MARRRSRTLTEVELEIMQLLWAEEEATVEDLAASLKKAGKPLAPSSIRTMLSILKDKGYVERRRLGRGHAYRPLVQAEEARKSILKDVVDRVFGGSTSSLVAALMSEGMANGDDIAKAKALIDEHDKGAE